MMALMLLIVLVDCYFANFSRKIIIENVGIIAVLHCVSFSVDIELLLINDYLCLSTMSNQRADIVISKCDFYGVLS